MACGSAFEILPDEKNKAGVQVVAMTYDPEKTAQEIGRRLLLRYSYFEIPMRWFGVLRWFACCFRMTRGSAGINPCQMN